MTSRRMRCGERDERGAALILAIAFLVVIGTIGGALLAAATSGVHNRQTLDVARDREYAADAGIESAVTQVRMLASPGPGLAACGPYTSNVNNVAIHVDCVGVPTLTFRGFLQRNVLFTACLQSDVSSGICNASKVVIRAQVNFQAVGSGAATVVTRTWVQSWSVNG